MPDYEINKLAKVAVSRHMSFTLEIGKAVLFEEYCQTLQRKKGDVLREMMDEFLVRKGIVR